MTTPAKSGPRGRVFVWTHDPQTFTGGRVSPSIEFLPRLDQEGEGRGRLWGRHVRVRNGGEINEPESTNGGVRAVPIGDALPDKEGDFLFEPSRGGGRVDRVSLPEEDLRRRYIQASHFGEVNTYFHLDRIASYVSGLLKELGCPPLPRLAAVVHAHHAATEKDGLRDGVWSHRGRWVPFQGGHYRLPSWRYDVHELQRPCADGEVHLGPGWQLLASGEMVQAVGSRYWHNAAHNAAILYHEYGHHIMRHTADVRANASRPPERQSNRKAAIEEGTCDYWVAAMLGTPHIWAWHRRHDDQGIHRRSLSSDKTMAEYDFSPNADPHSNGTIWAAALWELRTRLKSSDPDGARRTDLMVLKALVELGKITSPEGEAPRKYLPRLRASYAVGLASVLTADELLYSGRHREVILSCFNRRGIYAVRAGSHHPAWLKVLSN